MSRIDAMSLTRQASCVVTSRVSHNVFDETRITFRIGDCVTSSFRLRSCRVYRRMPSSPPYGALLPCSGRLSMNMSLLPSGD